MNCEVSSYLTNAPKILHDLRALCLKILIGYTEEIRHKMPCYIKNNKVKIAFAIQKNYISFYVIKKEVMDEHKPLLSKLNHGNSCIRFKKAENIDFNLIEILLKSTAS